MNVYRSFDFDADGCEVQGSEAESLHDKGHNCAGNCRAGPIWRPHLRQPNHARLQGSENRKCNRPAFSGTNLFFDDLERLREVVAAELPAGRTPQRGFNAAQGDFSDAPQLCPCS
jgi:hypothetical protein